MAKRKRSAFSCKSRSQRRPSPRLPESLGLPFTALSRQGGYAHILKGYFYTNLVGTLMAGICKRSIGWVCHQPITGQQSLFFERHFSHERFSPVVCFNVMR